MLELAFITSSRIKRAHAEHLCRDYDLIISGQKNYGVGYNEPRISQRESLLEQSITDALDRWRKNASNPDAKFFFIEDTSVVIHALSSEDNEVPGVDIKYWMQEHDFASVDALLKQHGNDRQVSVHSVVLLCLPEGLGKSLKEKYMYFISHSSGTIVKKEFHFDTNPVYPWLDNKTFNKWFVPDGCDVPISMLDINEADKHDFRAVAFNQMLEFLVLHGRLRKRSPDQVQKKQLGLATQPTLYLVSGPTCAGKTTLAEYLVHQYGFYHIEASDFMHLSYHQKHGVGSSVKIRDFAHSVLQEDPGIVVRQIMNHLQEIGKASIVITGFRSPEEVDAFSAIYTGVDDVEVIYIDASYDIRLERYVKRARKGVSCMEEFRQENSRQEEMGLKEIGANFCEDHLYNEATFDDLHTLFDEVYGRDVDVLKSEAVEQKLAAPSRLEDAVLISLFLAAGTESYYTTTDISKLIGDVFKEFKIVKNKNNVSRYFNQYFRPYYEITVENETRKYRLSQTGKMHAQWMMKNLSERKHVAPKQKPDLPDNQFPLFE
jgi:dephospho-CoA kinase/inosine/xanthosine triphosphate pyrophosphatase family protein